jgi:hypothetical protein
MEFLIEPLEIAVELDRFLDREVAAPLRCAKGYACVTGIAATDSEEGCE